MCIRIYYGVHYCINAVTETQGVESTVLLRSAEPITDIEVVSARRGINCKETESCRGPGKLARAFGITDKSDGISLCMSKLFIAKLPADTPQIGVPPRIGISRYSELPLRFFDESSAYVSGECSANKNMMRVK